MKKNRPVFEILSLILAIVILVGCTAKPTAAPQPTEAPKLAHLNNLPRRQLLKPRLKCNTGATAGLPKV